MMYSVVDNPDCSSSELGKTTRRPTYALETRMNHRIEAKHALPLVLRHVRDYWKNIRPIRILPTGYRLRRLHATLQTLSLHTKIDAFATRNWPRIPIGYNFSKVCGSSKRQSRRMNREPIYSMVPEHLY